MIADYLKRNNINAKVIVLDANQKVVSKLKSNIKFYKVGSSEPLDYDGPRTFEGFVEFLKMHSTTPDEVSNAIAGRKDEL